MILTSLRNGVLLQANLQEDGARKAGSGIFCTGRMQALLDRPKIKVHGQACIDAVAGHVQGRAVP